LSAKVCVRTFAQPCKNYIKITLIKKWKKSFWQTGKDLFGKLKGFFGKLKPKNLLVCQKDLLVAKKNLSHKKINITCI